jgi:hypothetical protein
LVSQKAKMLYILPPPSAPNPPSPWESIVMCGAQNKLNRPTTENRTFKKFGLRPLGRSKTCGRYRMSKKVSFFSFFSQPFFLFSDVINKEKFNDFLGKKQLNFIILSNFKQNSFYFHTKKKQSI